MAPYYTEHRGIFSGVVVITLLMFALVSIVAVLMNANCQSNFWDNQLIYPNAVLLERESAFLGIQRVVYQSTDRPAVVEQWYRTQNAARRIEQRQAGDFTSPQQLWRIEPAAVGGSILTLAAICPSGTPF